MDHQVFGWLPGSYGEFVRASAVVATLTCFAIEVRQQNLESRANGVHTVLSGFRDVQPVFGAAGRWSDHQ